MLHKGLVKELVENSLTAPYLAGEAGKFDRVFPSVIPQKIPQGAKQTPCVVYELRDVSRQTTHCGVSGLIRSSMQLDSYSKTYDEAKTVADSVRRALSDFRGMLGGIVDTRTATLENEFDVVDLEPGLYRVSQTWSFWHVE